MKLHAGSLYKNYLVLYGADGDPSICIQVDNRDTQWDIYCNDVEIELVDDKNSKVTFNGQKFHFPYIQTDEPMKTLGFA